MTPRMWFTLILRYLGASEIFTGLNNFVTAYNVHAGYYASSASALAFVNHGVASVAVGLIVLLGAPYISARIVLPLQPRREEPTNTEPSNV